MADQFRIAAPHIGTTEYKEKSDSIPVDLLPSNKMVYLTKMNSREETTFEGDCARLHVDGDSYHMAEPAHRCG